MFPKALSELNQTTKDWCIRVVTSDENDKPVIPGEPGETRNPGASGSCLCVWHRALWVTQNDTPEEEQRKVYEGSGFRLAIKVMDFDRSPSTTHISI